ncbi:MAG TPA: hypothetical protein VEA41_10460 [Salinarimonas sp.]|nr:hypothetical protein [Salinarimonas sp.]
MRLPGAIVLSTVIGAVAAVACFRGEAEAAGFGFTLVVLFVVLTFCGAFDR